MIYTILHPFFDWKIFIKKSPTSKYIKIICCDSQCYHDKTSKHNTQSCGLEIEDPWKFTKPKLLALKLPILTWSLWIFTSRRVGPNLFVYPGRSVIEFFRLYVSTKNMTIYVLRHISYQDTLFSSNPLIFFSFQN